MSECTTPYQKEYSRINPSLYSAGQRRKKAEKILAVLRDLPSRDLGSCRALEVGCSTGMNTGLLSESCRECIGIDIDDEALRFARGRSGPRAEFVGGDAMQLPFRDGSMDLVVCNHVYEHVPSAGRMVDEIFRVLRPGGICYFAAGNKYSIIEGHYRLPFLSWLPKPLADRYMRIYGRGTAYYENHLSYPALRRLVGSFTVRDYTLRIIREPGRFRAEEMVREGSLLTRMPGIVYRIIWYLLPTYILILEKPGEAPA